MRFNLSRIAFCATLLVFSNRSASATELHPVWKYPPKLSGAIEQVYKTVGDIKLKAWIFQPKEAKEGDRRPAIVFFFGGGWRGGTPGQFYPQCQYLAKRGMVAITVDYRVSGRHKVLAPVCLADAKSAIRWVRKNAKSLGVDPKRIVASGGSAGGHLAAAVGVVPGFDDPSDNLDISAIPNAIALYNPAVILGKIDGEQQLPDDKITDIAARTANKAVELSPYTHIRKGLPPTIIFHGTNDEAVPYWTVAKYEKAMIDKGNRCELKTYIGAPHGFFNTGRGGSTERKDWERQRYAATTLQLDRFLQSLGYLKGKAQVTATDRANLYLRDNFKNCLHQFRDKKQAHVAFMGGSITQMNGYRPMVCKWLQDRFPETEFTFTNAGIASTCSTSGAFRVSSHVLQKGKVDLFLVEFAVNDDQDAAHAERECIRGMEGVIAQVRKHNPMADILMVHFVNPPIKSLIDRGKVPTSIVGHEKVARHYRVSTVNLAREISDQIKAGKLTWAKYGGTHPKPPGNRLAADLVARLLEDAWASASAQIEVEAHDTPADLVDPGSYIAGRFVDGRNGVIKLGGTWQFSVPNWQELKGSFRRQFAGQKCYHGNTPGDGLQIEFKGKTLGAFVLAGPDAGQLEISVDGGPYQRVELYHRFSRGLHYPRTVILATDLKDGQHRALVRVAKTRHKKSQGHAARILHFVAN